MASESDDAGFPRWMILGEGVLVLADSRRFCFCCFSSRLVRTLLVERDRELDFAFAFALGGTVYCIFVILYLSRYAGLCSCVTFLVLQRSQSIRH